MNDRPTIAEALETDPRLRTSVQRQLAYIAALWEREHPCRACGERHSVTVCGPRGWMHGDEFPEDELLCPKDLTPVRFVVGLCSETLIVVDEGRKS